jgi:hypothetical protein
MEAQDLKALARLWPNRTHESNWSKAALCALGVHRWYRIDVNMTVRGVQYSFCRWCPKVKVDDTESPQLRL